KGGAQRGISRTAVAGSGARLGHTRRARSARSEAAPVVSARTGGRALRGGGGGVGCGGRRCRRSLRHGLSRLDRRTAVVHRNGGHGKFPRGMRAPDRAPWSAFRRAARLVRARAARRKILRLSFQMMTDIQHFVVPAPVEFVIHILKAL